MKQNTNTGTRNSWKEFLLSKGFQIRFEDEYCCIFIGCTPYIRVELYDYPCRTNTNTGGCICADFDSEWNKISSCPIYFGDDVKQDKFWEAIVLLMGAGIEWSRNRGRIEEGNGFLFCYPPINNNKHGRRDKR